jgi:Transposase DDE domain group 1
VTQCTQASFEFPALKRRRVHASFDGGAITSDAGALLLRQVDRQLSLTQAVAGALNDPRRRASCEHDTRTLVRQRIYALALGYEDLNDHQHLRTDAVLQTAVERDTVLASQSTLCRFENHAGRETAWQVHRVLVEQFIASFKHRPKKLILDFDATDDAVHGKQEGRFFHGYYDKYCFLPLYVFCRDQLLMSYLRQSNIDGARHAWAILALLVKRLRQVWPKVRIVFRADSGFCRHRMLSWCERNDVGYIVGIARNTRLESLSAALQDKAAQHFQTHGTRVRWFTEFHYGAKTRPRLSQPSCVRLGRDDIARMLQ